ncbi:hypothetical protein PM10SUCC1_08600 [Propionigenium maris DSM 9537]|uniref:Uncharacterized protein n=1 Tax=Propionigenium maris DSM 9537 TaxID=1123000 RepID=A0A9W6GK85_9FUSO|nr:hypothetical protein [Propionigenium maris]GLI55346.1 hypothetical protein PM10SUCC1_08600 [Propionigenium maris DSM 9537]
MRKILVGLMTLAAVCSYGAEAELEVYHQVPEVLEVKFAESGQDEVILSKNIKTGENNFDLVVKSNSHDVINKAHIEYEVDGQNLDGVGSDTFNMVHEEVAEESIEVVFDRVGLVSGEEPNIYRQRLNITLPEENTQEKIHGMYSTILKTTVTIN